MHQFLIRHVDYRKQHEIPYRSGTPHTLTIVSRCSDREVITGIPIPDYLCIPRHTAWNTSKLLESFSGIIDITGPGRSTFFYPVRCLSNGWQWSLGGFMALQPRRDGLGWTEFMVPCGRPRATDEFRRGIMHKSLYRANMHVFCSVSGLRGYLKYDDTILTGFGLTRFTWHLQRLRNIP